MIFKWDWYRIWQCQNCNWHSERMSGGCVIPKLERCPKCGSEVKIETKQLSMLEKALRGFKNDCSNILNGVTTR